MVVTVVHSMVVMGYIQIPKDGQLAMFVLKPDPYNARLKTYSFQFWNALRIESRWIQLLMELRNCILFLINIRKEQHQCI